MLKIFFLLLSASTIFFVVGTSSSEPRPSVEPNPSLGLSPWERLDGPLTAEVVVDWTKGWEYVGKTISVEGTIVDSHNSGKACFLNFTPYDRTDAAAEQKIFLVILGHSFCDFPDSPEKTYLGKSIRATGKVKVHEGRPEIVLRSPQQIEFR